MNKQYSTIKISVLLSIVIILLLALGAAFVITIVNVNMHQQALAEAESKALILLNRNLATHSYYSKILKPRLFTWTEPFRTKEYFEPSWMSSTYAVREIDKYFKELSPSDYYIKDAAINARSPENEADEYESAFLKKLNADPTVQELSAVRTIDGQHYLTVLRRGEVMDETCLPCHSTPDNAPSGLVDIYGPERSFNRYAGETISTISIRIPLEEAYAKADRISLQFSVMLLLMLGVFFVAQFWVYQRVLLKPVTVLRDKASQIIEDESHLGEQLQLPIGRELTELTASFNTMSLNLRQSRDNLEMRIQERTAELLRAQGELEAAHRELQQSFVQQQQLALIDDLTGINNHRSLLQLAKREFDVAMRYRPPLSMMFFDIDNFKQINDTFGHAIGDLALIKIIQNVCSILRSADLIGRYGGDEFIILLPQTSAQDALPLAERIHACVAALLLDTNKGPLTLTISIGIAQSLHGGSQTDTVEDLLLRADQALYAAKQSGKNCTVIFDSMKG